MRWPWQKPEKPTSIFDPYERFDEIEPGDRVKVILSPDGRSEFWVCESRTGNSLYLVDLNTGSMIAQVTAHCVTDHRPKSWFSEYPRDDVTQAAKAAGLFDA